MTDRAPEADGDGDDGAVEERLLITKWSGKHVSGGPFFFDFASSSTRGRTCRLVGEIELTPIGVALDGSRRVRPSFARTRPPTAGTASTWSAPRGRGASGKAGKASRRGTRGRGDKRPWRKGRGSIGRGSLKRPRGHEARGTVTRPRSQEATEPRGHGDNWPWRQGQEIRARRSALSLDGTRSLAVARVCLRAPHTLSSQGSTPIRRSQQEG